MSLIDFHSLGLFMVVGLALNITPGPDMLYVAARGASEGRAAGIASAFGIAVGCFVHIILVAGGLAALLAAVPIAYHVIRLAGAAYLIYLGVKALVLPSGFTEHAVVPASTWTIFSQGIVTNVLNPKVAFFFLAFIPQFVDPSRGSPALQILILGLLFNTSGTIVNLIIAFGASGLSHRLRQSPRAEKILQRITGILFVGLGLRLAINSRQ